MDMWSDPNLSPFMAVTAHWIEGVEEETASGTKLNLKLRSDLIGFQNVPSRHTGEHMAHAFLHITDHLKVTNKVSFIIIIYNFSKLTWFVKLDWMDYT
jgi:hypothetical protein